MKKLIAFASICLIIGCGDVERNNLEATQFMLSSIIPASYTVTAQLGQGYDSLRFEPLASACVTGDIKVDNNSYGELHYEKDMTFEKIFQVLNGDLEVGVGFPTVKVNGSAQLAKEWGHDSLSETYHLYWIATREQKLLDPFTLQLTDAGRRIVQEYPDKVYQRCGDEFISAIHYGAGIMATMRIDFASEYDKMDLSGKVVVNVGKPGIGEPKVDVDGSLKYVNQSKKERSTVRLSVKQFGGDPTGLTTILPESIMTCTMSDPSPCMKAFENLISYMKGDFKQQLSDMANYNVLRYETERYESSLLQELVPSQYPEIPPEVAQIRLEAESEVLHNGKVAERAARLRATTGPFLSSDNLASIMDIEDKASANERVWKTIGQYCYRFIDARCQNNYNLMKSRVQSYDESKLDVNYVY